MTDENTHGGGDVAIHAIGKEFYFDEIHFYFL